MLSSRSKEPLGISKNTQFVEDKLFEKKTISKYHSIQDEN